MDFYRYADWFDGKRKESDATLDEWVKDSKYHHGVITPSRLLEHLRDLPNHCLECTAL